MSIKQDRPGARTPADLERKYNFGKTFAEFMGLIDDAQQSADDANKAVDKLNKELTQEEIFNRLTNNGEVQGIYRENGDIYINASYIKTGILLANLIKAGILQSKDGKTFYLDLDNGILKGRFTELSISGKSVDDIAQEKASEAAGTAESNAKDYADTAAANAVSAQTQTDIFNKLTGNGEAQGVYLQDGQLYINAQYLMAGTFTSKAMVYLPPTKEDMTNILWSVSFPDLYPPEDSYDLDGDGTFSQNDYALAMKAYLGKMNLADCPGAVKTEVTVTIDSSNPEKTILISGTNMWGTAVEYYLGASGSNFGIHKGNLVVGGTFSVGGAVEFETNDNNEALMSIGMSSTPKVISWKDNGDGTYTLIGR